MTEEKFRPWREPDLACELRPPGQLALAGKVIGSSLHLAIESAIRLQRMTQRGRHPVAPHKPGFDQDAWSLLQMMLIEERRLIEFVRGPATIKRNGQIVVSNPDDICKNCFATSHGTRWSAAPAAMTTLMGRLSRINKRVTHFSWTLTESDLRVDTGHWRTGYLRIVARELASFAKWMTIVNPHAAEPLADMVASVQADATHLAPEVEG